MASFHHRQETRGSSKVAPPPSPRANSKLGDLETAVRRQSEIVRHISARVDAVESASTHTRLRMDAFARGSVPVPPHAPVTSARAGDAVADARAGRSRSRRDAGYEFEAAAGGAGAGASGGTTSVRFHSTSTRAHAGVTSATRLHHGHGLVYGQPATATVYLSKNGGGGGGGGSASDSSGGDSSSVRYGHGCDVGAGTDTSGWRDTFMQHRPGSVDLAQQLRDIKAEVDRNIRRQLTSAQ